MIQSYSTKLISLVKTSTRVAVACASLAMVACGSAPSSGASTGVSNESTATTNWPGHDPACNPHLGYTCTEKAGLGQGQKFKLMQSLTLSKGTTNAGWAYFSDGRQTNPSEMNEGQEYCAIGATQGLMPAELTRNGVATVPALFLTLTEISWYVDTVFFQGQLPDQQTVGLVVYCGTIVNGDLGDGRTSLKTIRKHLIGMLNALN